MMICMEQAYPLRRRYCASVSAAKALLGKRISGEGVIGISDRCPRNSEMKATLVWLDRKLSE